MILYKLIALFNSINPLLYSPVYTHHSIHLMYSFQTPLMYKCDIGRHYIVKTEYPAVEYWKAKQTHCFGLFIQLMQPVDAAAAAAAAAPWKMATTTT